MTPRFVRGIVLVSSIALALPAPPVTAQSPKPGPVAVEASATEFNVEQLDALLASIALYPDQLLTQMLMASTYPLQIVAASRWLAQGGNKDLKNEALTKALESQAWDPSVKSLVPFPQVLAMLNDNLEWTQQLGWALANQQAAVLDSSQRLRRQAQNAGNLKTTEQQRVEVVQENTIIIQPADPQVVYVPTYQPTEVYGEWPYPDVPPIYYPPPAAYYPGYAYAGAGLAFAAGVAITAGLWGWANSNWRAGNVTVNAARYNNINVNRGQISSGNWRGGRCRRPSWPAARWTGRQAGPPQPAAGQRYRTRQRPGSGRCDKPPADPGRGHPARRRARYRRRSAARWRTRHWRGTTAGRRAGHNRRPAPRRRTETWRRTGTWRPAALSTPRRGGWAISRWRRPTCQRIWRFERRQPRRTVWRARRAEPRLSAKRLQPRGRRLTTWRWGRRLPRWWRWLPRRGRRRWPRRPAVRESPAMMLRMAAAALVLLAAMGGFAASPPAPVQSYATAEEAAAALAEALKSGKPDAIMGVLGQGSENLVNSGDAVVDATARQKFTAAYDEKHQLSANGADKMTLVVGNEDWPLPIPLVKSADGRWHFDSAAGAQELIDRRIGRDEIAAIRTCLTYVDAQKQYFEIARQVEGTAFYAQRLVSSPGRHDGLYWEPEDGEDDSPLAPLADQARDEGYPGAQASGEPRPYFGYYFRILTGQGPNSPKGAMSYIGEDGKMTKGFGLVAWPASYGASGIMAFVVNQDGTVFQKDLGPDTTSAAAKLKLFDPDLSWSRIDVTN